MLLRISYLSVFPFPVFMDILSFPMNKKSIRTAAAYDGGYIKTTLVLLLDYNNILFHVISQNGKTEQKPEEKNVQEYK